MHRKLKLFVPKVTRLCDLTNDNDTVTSVSWAERGNFVAVGTHRGYVQVIFASSFRKSHRLKILRIYISLSILVTMKYSSDLGCRCC